MVTVMGSCHMIYYKSFKQFQFLSEKMTHFVVTVCEFQVQWHYFPLKDSKYFRNVLFHIMKETSPIHITIFSNQPIAFCKNLGIRKRFISFCFWKQQTIFCLTENDFFKSEKFIPNWFYI